MSTFLCCHDDYLFIYLFIFLDLIPAIQSHGQVSSVNGLCPQRDTAYSPSSSLTIPPSVSSNFTRRSYCILSTLREASGNTNPVLHFTSGTTVVGNFSVINGVISHTLRGVTARFTGQYNTSTYEHITVCVNAQTSEALLYIDCENSPRERVSFIQSASGTLADGFVAFKSSILSNNTFQVKYMYMYTCMYTVLLITTNFTME